MCFIPRGIENSAGDVVFLPKDDRLGPLSGRMVGSSFGYCEHYLVLREEIGGGVQGGVMPLAGDFLSGAHRSRFNKYDGAVYFAGSDGWKFIGETFVKVSLPISVQIHQSRQLIPTDNVHISVVNHQAKRLGQSGGNPLPD